MDSKERTNALEDPRRVRSVRIFSYPKIIFIWPTMVFAFICGIGMMIAGDQFSPREIAQKPVLLDATGDGEADADAVTTSKSSRRFTSWPNLLGLIFLAIFTMNMMIMSLDFPRFTIIAGVLLVLTITFLILWLAPRVDFMEPLERISWYIYTVANAGFYFVLGTILLVMFAGIWATRYLDYWEIRPNEILHHHGPLSDLERYPTLNLKFDKEIPDVLEFLLGLGAGRLVLHFGHDRRTVELENVLFINSKEEALKQIMGQLNVRVMEERGDGR
ncbi:hypothetical protein BH23PLA1_BH23PLA1_02990 [soil metagenome]